MTLGELPLGAIATVSWAGVPRLVKVTGEESGDAMVTGKAKGWNVVWARIRYAGGWTDPWPLSPTTPVLKVSQLSEVA